MGKGDITRVNLAIDRMDLVPLSKEQRRQAATTVCDVMSRSGQPLETARLLLQMLGLSTVGPSEG
jgi:hypothetical protein